MKPTLLILAAGMGSRYGGLKQIDGIGPNEEPIIEYSIIGSSFGPIPSICFNPPYRLPIPAAKINNVGFIFIFYILFKNIFDIYFPSISYSIFTTVPSLNS